MALIVTCPLCDETFNVKEKYLGKIGGCPHCHGKIAIPESLPDAETIFVGDDDSQVDPNSSRYTRKPPQKPAPQPSVPMSRPNPAYDVTDQLEEQSLTIPYNTLTSGKKIPRKGDNTLLKVGLALSTVATVILAIALTVHVSSKEDPVAPSSLQAAEPEVNPQVTYMTDQLDATVEMIHVLSTVKDGETAEAAVPGYLAGLRRQLACCRDFLAVSPGEDVDPPEREIRQLKPDLIQATLALKAEKARIWEIPEAAQVLNTEGGVLSEEYGLLLKQLKRRHPHLKIF